MCQVSVYTSFLYENKLKLCISEVKYKKEELIQIKIQTQYINI